MTSVQSQYISDQVQGIPVRSQYASVRAQGNTTHSVASVQILIDRTLGELCNVKETHLTKLTLTLLTVEYSMHRSPVYY